MGLWAALTAPRNSAVPPTEQEVVKRLTERSMAQADANRAAIEKAKAEQVKQQRRDEAMATVLAAKYAGRTED